MRGLSRSPLRLAGCLLLVGLAPLSAQRGGGPAPAAVTDFRFQFMGPASGGRVASIAGVPGDTNVWYVGNASGGVWKSVDAGRSFVPVFDSMPAQAIGALAVPRTAPSTVWAGTGEAWAIRDADVMGNGIYKSTDGGATWTNMGLRETGRIGRIVVHPTNPEIVYVCALGRATGPQQERGVYRTTDGGRNWERVLFVDPNTGCSGLTISAQNPEILFAGMWQVEMHTWAMFSGGASSGLYMSRDGGTTWTRLSRGLPRSPLGKIDVDVAATDSQRVYALIQTVDQGSVWRSDDGGRTWRLVNRDRPLIGRAGYYIHLAINTGDPNEVYIANSSFFRSTDGGTTFEEVGWGGDNHDIWVDPLNPDRIGTTDDGGARVSTTRGRTGTRVNLPNGQNYHVAVDTRVPYWIYSNRQDDGTMRGPSNAPEAVATAGRGGGGRGFGGGRGGGGFGGRGARGFPVNGFAASSTWDHGLGGCESGFTIPDPTDADIVWATCYGNKVTRYDAKTGVARSVAPWQHTLDFPPNDSKYRCHWSAPLAIDPFDHTTVYYGCQVIFRTTNAGQSWSVISPDLSTRDPSRIVSSGGLVGDNLGQFAGEVVFAIAPSPVRKGLIWAGTNDGKVWYTPDGGTNWVDVSANVGMPAWGTVRKIEPSPFDAATAYIAVDYHMMDNRDPFIYRTSDYGRSWQRISDGLPHGEPLDYVMAVTENPNRRGMLFAGTGNGFFYSLNDGATWTRFQAGLPQAPVTWIVVPKLWHDVVVSTYGRGLFILHDITPLEQSDQPSSGAVRLHAPRPAWRQARSGQSLFTFTVDRLFDSTATIAILDSTGTVIRTLTGRAHAGRNLASWDLRYEAPEQPALRTAAPDNPEIFSDSRFKGRETRPVTHWGIEGPMRAAPIAAPGRYTVRLTIDSVSHSQPFEVLKDPAIAASSADLVASTAMQVRMRDDLTATSRMINRMEVMRKQIEDQLATQAGRANQAALRKFDQRILGVELQLLSRSDLNSDDKYFVEAWKVYMGLLWLYGEVGLGAGDVAGGADYRPTDASVQVLAEIERNLDRARADFDTLISRDLPAFNRSMAGKLPPITD